MIVDTKKLKSQFSSKIITRFAPSPTGLLHLGHIASAIYVWGISQAVEAEVKIRLEDHDRQRCKDKYCAAILEDLEWLGFLNLPSTSSKPVMKQSKRSSIYYNHLKILEKKDLVYQCTCSRKKIKAENTKKNLELFYPGHCRSLFLSHKDSYSLRYKVAKKEVFFYDALQILQKQQPYLQCGDFVIKDRKDNWTYHFCVVVDDLEENTNLIIRGLDLLPSTGRQILLSRDLSSKNTDTIRYLHHPLITDPFTRLKLSKQNKSEPISTLRKQGFSPSQVLTQAAFLIGLNPKQKNIYSSNLVELINGKLMT